MTTPTIRVAVVGAGFVGSALIRQLSDPTRSIALMDAANARIEVVGIAVRDVERERPGVARDLLTGDAEALVRDGDYDVLVELAGGLSPARHLVETALTRGASVVTANKTLMAECGTELSDLAHEHGVDLYYEAAVAGGIPIVRSLRTSLAGERIDRVVGIVNGTTNFILSKMTSEGSDYAEALAEAQALGYAEADPSADVEGFDAAAKVQILSSLAFGNVLVGEPIDREGITRVRAVDVEAARRRGYVIKLLGVAERVGEHGIVRATYPAMVSVEHPLAAVHGAMNAVFVEGSRSGPLMWLGQGAGGDATATAVLGDLLLAARNRASASHDVPFTPDDRLYAVPTAETAHVFYISIDVKDEPGVLAGVAGIFGRHGVSIHTMEQSGVGDEARLSFVTHRAVTRDVLATVQDLARFDPVDSIGACIRVFDGGDS